MKSYKQLLTYVKVGEGWREGRGRWEEDGMERGPGKGDGKSG